MFLQNGLFASFVSCNVMSGGPNEHRKPSKSLSDRVAEIVRGRLKTPQGSRKATSASAPPPPDKATSEKPEKQKCSSPLEIVRRFIAKRLFKKKSKGVRATDDRAMPEDPPTHECSLPADFLLLQSEPLRISSKRATASEPLRMATCPSMSRSPFDNDSIASEGRQRPMSLNDKLTLRWKTPDKALVDALIQRRRSMRESDDEEDGDEGASANIDWDD
ncbi:hypothetical protein L596_018046 [Steinernema carpocapsae]|uniref:Uncharacterized protein n=1 Tax=Steinernema carpocapsae TaxID=34508 RepID=A0A4U5N488_STECR|nr:hypothetical protein L596_018046 [Steinernema carpocapsae]